MSRKSGWSDDEGQTVQRRGQYANSSTASLGDTAQTQEELIGPGILVRSSHAQPSLSLEGEVMRWGNLRTGI